MMPNGMNAQQPTPQMGGGMPPRPMQGPPPQGVPAQGAPAGGPGMPQQAGAHGDPTSNFYASLQQTLMPFVGKIQGLDQVLAVINQQHIKYLSPQSQPMPGKMPAGRMGQ